MDDTDHKTSKLSLEQITSLIPYLGGVTFDDIRAYADVEEGTNFISTRKLVKQSYIFVIKCRPGEQIATINAPFDQEMKNLTQTLMYHLFRCIISLFADQMLTGLEKTELLKCMSSKNFVGGWSRCFKIGFRADIHLGTGTHLKLDQVILPEEKSYAVRIAAQQIILMFEDVCNTHTRYTCGI